ncbi:MAG: 3-keto-disaccharide hydrolase [Pirellulaceae bacterium]
MNAERNCGFVKMLLLAVLMVAPTVSCNAQESDTATDAASTETIVLFDGSNLDHWRGYHQEAIGEGWQVDDGILKFDGSGGGDIITRESFGDLELEFEWLVTPGANSGIMYRVGLGDSAPYLTGPEYQILDDELHPDGKNPLTSAASLYALYDRGETETKPVGEWNTGKIVIRGNTVQHWLNGKLAVETELGSDQWNELVTGSKFNGWEKFGKNAEGHICLQDHNDEVWYRNIRITVPAGE